MKEGRSFSTLSHPIIPRTDEDAERIARRGEKSKEVLYLELKVKLREALLVHSEDVYLVDTMEFLSRKSHKYFNPKAKLVALIDEVNRYIEDMEFKSMCDDVLAVENSDVEDNGLDCC